MIADPFDEMSEEELIRAFKEWLRKREQKRGGKRVPFPEPPRCPHCGQRVPRGPWIKKTVYLEKRY